MKPTEEQLIFLTGLCMAARVNACARDKYPPDRRGIAEAALQDALEVCSVLERNYVEREHCE